MAGHALWRATVRDDVLRELVYTAREVDGVEGERLGLVTRVVDDPLAAALALAHEIAGRHPAAVRAAKRLIGAAADGDAATVLAAERTEQAALLGTADQREQVTANLEKRPAVFGDRTNSHGLPTG